MSRRVTIVCAVCERPAWLGFGCLPVESVRRSHPDVVKGLSDLQIVCVDCVSALIDRQFEAGRSNPPRSRREGS